MKAPLRESVICGACPATAISPKNGWPRKPPPTFISAMDLKAMRDPGLRGVQYVDVLGTPRGKDRLVFGVGTPNVNIDPADIPFVATGPSASYALGIVAHGVRNEITAYVAPLDALSGATVPWKRFCDVDDDVTGFDVHAGDLYLLSHHGASLYKVLHTKLSDPDVAGAEGLLPPSEAVVQNIAAASAALYIQALDR